MALHGDLEHYQLCGVKPHPLLPFKRAGERLSFTLGACKNQHQSENIKQTVLASLSSDIDVSLPKPTEQRFSDIDRSAHPV